MQTFLAYDDYQMSAKVLDKRRLFKQVVEAKQILASLGHDIRKNDKTRYKPTHKNHPAIKMWRNYQNSLKQYHNIFLEECFSRGIKTPMSLLPIMGSIIAPRWLGDSNFHKSHRANLLRKDKEFYGVYGWTEPNTLEYVWPEGTV